MPDPRLLVVGAGAIGGVIAARLTQAGHDVTVLDADVEHAQRMRAPGLSLQEHGTTSTVRLAAEHEAAGLRGRFDAAVVTVKAPHLAAALAPLVQADRVDTYLALGNGLVQDRVERLVGRHRLVVGIVEWGATNLGPGRLVRTTRAPFVLDAHGMRQGRMPLVAAALEQVAPVRLVDDVQGQIWSKLLVNSTFSGLGAVTGLLYGDIVDTPPGRQVALSLWTEGYDVARAGGIRLAPVIGVRPERLTVRSPADMPTAQASLEVLMGAVAATKSSMLQDLERGAVTEVDDINGGVTRHAARLGMPAPLNQRVVDLVHACERGERRPDPAAMRDLATVSPGSPGSPSQTGSAPPAGEPR